MDEVGNKTQTCVVEGLRSFWQTFHRWQFCRRSSGRIHEPLSSRDGTAADNSHVAATGGMRGLTRGSPGRQSDGATSFRSSKPYEGTKVYIDLRVSRRPGPPTACSGVWFAANFHVARMQLGKPPESGEKSRFTDAWTKKRALMIYCICRIIETKDVGEGRGMLRREWSERYQR